MIPWFHVFLFVLSVCLFYFAFRKGVRKGGRLPPYDGWIPWLGCAIKFGENPIDFIEAKRRQLGSVFTLKVAGEHITFVCDPEDFHYVFKSSKVSFPKSVQDPVNKVAGITRKSFNEIHTKMHDTLKGQLATTQLSSTCDLLFKKFEHFFGQLKENVDPQQETDLYGIVRSIMYRSVIHIFFGEGSIPVEKEEDFLDFENHFMTFDEQFEYGTRLPVIFIRKWAASRQWLLEKCERVVSLCTKTMPKEPKDKNIFQNLLPLIDEDNKANWSLLTLWAALANAIPLSFWVLTFVYQDKKVLGKVQREIDAALKDGRPITESVLSEMPYTLRCVMEGIRLRSPGMIPRRVVEPIVVKGYTVPPGHMLSVSPYWVNRNPDIYEDPELFNPDRWSDWTPGSIPETFIPFGGGRYMCPGRWFALMEIHMFVAMFFHTFDCHLTKGIPDFCKLHLVGSQQPLQNCPVTLKPRVIN
ncbi:24-hydroxycholesterol 7-alpha-hydroxylase [Aplysia californica]|uniref:24-hydroxycholesterol 7-alpha-hydroxylase n=1 Tax=Aplysia californica TaxID=6500 RepID=A0ABM0JTW0_APLCA|nr:24-hydroxycholesterol 7-alpha-hydroxylase [Aplysia californica]